jgi:hypothetical protein
MIRDIVRLGSVGAAGLVGYVIGSRGLGLLPLAHDSVRVKMHLKRDPENSDRCVAITNDGKKIKAKREGFVAWKIVGPCRLPAGGRVQLRFDGGVSPLDEVEPTESRGYIAGIVLEDAVLRNYRYKVWAHFPETPGADYILEDPDLEIVMYF